MLKRLFNIAIAVHELIAEKDELSASQRTRLDLYTQAVAAYQPEVRDFSKAISLFQKVLALHPEDQVSKIYLQRCLAFLASPPADDWDGVYRATSK